MSSGKQHRTERIFATILGSLSKILIKNNIPLGNAVELLKRSLVEAAAEDESTTDSLISLRTGVHRKDVKRLRSSIIDGVSENSPIRGLAVVLATWSHTKPFVDDAGQRRILMRRGRPGQPGFDDLIKASKIDLAAATVLQELETQALVKLHEDGGIELLSETFVAQSGEAALKAFEATVTDHLRIATSNILAPPGDPRYFDQVLRYSHLSAESVEQLEAEARRLARAYLEHMNALAHRLQSEDDASGQLADGRFVTGAYVAPRHPSQDTTKTPDPSNPSQPQTPKKDTGK